MAPSPLNTTQKIRDWATWNPLKFNIELRCFGIVSSSWSASAIFRVTHVQKLIYVMKEAISSRLWLPHKEHSLVICDKYSVAFCVVFCRSFLFVFFTFGHCTVCRSLIYGSNYHIGIFSFFLAISYNHRKDIYEDPTY